MAYAVSPTRGRSEANRIPVISLKKFWFRKNSSFPIMLVEIAVTALRWALRNGIGAGRPDGRKT